MLKIIIVILSLQIPLVASAQKIELKRCIDGDTAAFMIEKEEKIVRFLAIDTPENNEAYGEESSLYTCNLLSFAGNITIEYDQNSSRIDKYNRTLGWIFVDDSLIQKKIVENGYGKVAYLYGDYKYVEQLQIAEIKAQQNKLGIWKEQDNSINIVIIGILIIISLFLTNKEKKLLKKAIKKMR
jgi:micrococcal nuclease